MNDPRNRHIGKNKYEKEVYLKMLRMQQKEDPTFELQETESTNSVIQNETGSSTITKPDLKSYEPNKEVSVKNILFGLVLFAITTSIFLFGMSLNREVGVLEERNIQNREITNELKDEVKTINNNVTDLKLEIEVLKRFNSIE